MRIVTVTIAAAMLAVNITVPSDAQAQAPAARTPDVTTRAEKSRGGADQNIKQDRQAIGDSVTAAAPPAKSANATERTRQAGLCYIMVDNWTGYAVDVYVDGTYRGTMAAWGEFYTSAIAGPTVFYGRSAGGSLTWGPRTYQCNSSFTWRIDP